MRIAGSIILGVIGAVLYFAITIDAEGVSLSIVGLILMIAAGIWFVIEVIRGFTGERTRSTATVRNADGTVERRDTEVRETNVSDQP